MFNPAGVPPAGSPTPAIPQRYWNTKPFYEMTASDYATEQVAALMNEINQDNATLVAEVAAWRADPFDPDAIAQWRPVAYQRAIVMQYIDNLIAWGDQLFTQDTMETINLATQMYVLAANLLGPKPEIVPPARPARRSDLRPTRGRDRYQRHRRVLQRARRRRERYSTGQRPAPRHPRRTPTMPVSLYFQIPPNSQLLGYWDTVADRLYKIRHCMNIEGVVQQLPAVLAADQPGAAGGRRRRGARPFQRPQRHQRRGRRHTASAR